MTNYKPAEVFPPGEFIHDELKERGWTQGDLADIMDRPASLICNIISGKRSISLDIANELAEVFGTSAEYWLGHEAAYRLSLMPNMAGAVQHRAHLYSVAPVKEMQKRQWIPKTHTAEELGAALNRFYGTTSPDAIPETIHMAARAMSAETGLTPSQYTWCRQALRLAAGVSVARYKSTSIAEGLSQLRALAENPEDARKVPRILADMGIRFLLIEQLPHSRIDGAALWLPNGTPIVAVSSRYDRIDSFWFTLCHELAHIEAEDQRESFDKGAIDIDLIDEKPDSLEEAERRADQRAAEMLVPRADLDDFIIRKKPYFYKEHIIGFARTMTVHPGIVVGQLQHRGVIGYYANREMLVKIRDIVAKEALTDGWGHAITEF